MRTSPLTTGAGAIITPPCYGPTAPRMARNPRGWPKPRPRRSRGILAAPGAAGEHFDRCCEGPEMPPAPAYDHGGVTLHTGDVRAVLPTLPAESVQTVVTSPPFFGLRDYGTAMWDGGRLDCDHIERLARNDTERETPGD